MENERLIAHLAVLEGFVAGTMSLLFSMSGNDPDWSKAKAILQVLEAAIQDRTKDYPLHVQEEARRYASGLASLVIEKAGELREPNPQKQN